MSKFSAMCKAFDQAQQEFKSFRNSSYSFAEGLWRKLMEYYEVPASHVYLYNVSSDGAFQPATLPFEKILSLRNDGYWEFGLGIRVYAQPEAQPSDTVLIHILLRTDTKGGAQARLNDEVEVFHIHPDQPSSMEPFLDSVFASVLNSYRTGLERLLNEHSSHRIGFDLAEMTDSTRQATQPNIPDYQDDHDITS